MRLATEMRARGPLCVGIDPHPSLLAAWGLPDNADGLRRFSLGVVETLGERVAALKPQSALFERHGSRGIAVLEEVLAACRDVDTLSILDVKRGDIGSTMAAYADAYLRDGSPLAADAITISPYLGFGSLTPAIGLALETGRGVFALCLTSNPEGREVQHARRDGDSVAASIAAKASALNAGADPMGSVGLVVGATVGDAAQATETDLAALNGPILAPGFGAQGAGAAELRAVFGEAVPKVLATTSREVLKAGPNPNALVTAAEKAIDGLMHP